MSVKRARQPRGIPTGGEFANMNRDESGVLMVSDDYVSETDKALQIAKRFDEEASSFSYEIANNSHGEPYIASVDVLNDNGNVIGNFDRNYYVYTATGNVILAEEDNNLSSLWNKAGGAYLADGGHERGDVPEEAFYLGEECDNCGSSSVIVRSEVGRFCSPSCADAYELA